MIAIPFVVGQEAQLEVSLTPDDVRRFAEWSGDRSPLHLDPQFARSHGFDGPVVHGALLTAMVSQLVGMRLPGSLAVLAKMELSFISPCYAPCAIVLKARVRQVSEATSSIVIDVTITTADGRLISAGKTWHKLLTNAVPI